jgi:MFS family permease
VSVTDRVRGRYGVVAAVALLGLCPDVLLSTALSPLGSVLGHDLGTADLGVQVAAGLSNAGYALGAVGAAQLAQRHSQRRLFLGYQALFVVGSVLAGLAPGLVTFLLGRVLQGLAAGGMLISSLPPLVTKFGAGRLPLTVVIVNIGLFGTSTLGPMVGGAVAVSGHWRALLLGAAVVGLVGWCVAAVGYPRIDPLDPDLPVDRPALGLAGLATVATFLGTSLLAGVPLTSPAVLLPLVVGVAAVVCLVVVEARKEQPLMPVEALATQLPVTGTLAAMIGGAVFVATLQLVQTLLTDGAGLAPDAVGRLFWPMPAGLAVAAVLLGVLFRTRFVPVLVDVGLASLAASAALFMALDPADPQPLMAVGAALLGFGAGATVSPGLLLTGLGVPSRRLARAFALVQLLRSMATYAVAPVVLHVAQGGADLAAGVRSGLVVVLVLTVLGLAATLAVPALSGARLREPDLEAWLEGDQALPSPTTGIHLRPGVEDEAAEPLLPRPLRRR